jgi:ribosomal protein S12 methylthiotransferase
MLDLLEEIRFERVGVFTYSVEEGTRAAEMDGQLEQAVMNERLEELMEVQRDISFEKNLALVGKRTTALVDQRLEDDAEFVAVARTVAQAHEVDGVTNLIRPEGWIESQGLQDPGTIEPGSMIEVEIVDALDYDLIAKPRTG